MVKECGYIKLQQVVLEVNLMTVEMEVTYHLFLVLHALVVKKFLALSTRKLKKAWWVYLKRNIKKLFKRLM